MSSPAFQKLESLLWDSFEDLVHLINGSGEFQLHFLPSSQQVDSQNHQIIPAVAQFVIILYKCRQGSILVPEGHTELDLSWRHYRVAV